MFTIDASVYINALNPSEQGSPDSQAFLRQVFQHPRPVYSPTLLWVEIAAAVARVFDHTERGLAMARAIRGLPGQIWVSLDEVQAQNSARLAAEQRLRGADAVYAAVAQRYGATLVTRDQQQLERLSPILPVLTPAAALAHLVNLTHKNQEAE
jgi:predicted nucleic acid-binding protein